MDRAQVVSVTGTAKMPAGSFTNVLRTEETTPLERGEREYKLYAPVSGCCRMSRSGSFDTGRSASSGLGGGTVAVADRIPFLS